MLVGDPRARRGARRDARHYHFRGGRRRRGPGRSARHEATVRRDPEGSDRQIRLGRWHGAGHRQRRRGQQSLSSDVQGAGRPQLRRFRHGQSHPGDGAGHCQNRRLRGSLQPQDHIQRGARGRRHIGERHPVRGVDGGGYALLRRGCPQGAWTTSSRPPFARPWKRRTGVGTGAGR